MVKIRTPRGVPVPDLGAVLILPFTTRGLCLVTGPETYRDKYRFPGGGIKASDPSPKHAALREGVEETGIKNLRLEHFRFVHSWIRLDGRLSGEKGHPVYLFVAVIGEEPDVSPSKTGEKIKFFDAAGIEDDPRLLNRHQEILKNKEVIWRLKKALSHK